MQRYVLHSNSIELHEAFDVEFNSANDYLPTYNAAPGHLLPILKHTRSSFEIELAVWDVKAPYFLTDQALKPRNSSLFASPCIVPISGFYVWKQASKDQLPFYVRIHSQPIIGIAGFRFNEESTHNRFSILVQDAILLLQPICKKMPAILNSTQLIEWCNGSAIEMIKKGFRDNILIPDMTIYRVSDLVNDLTVNAPELIQPIPKVREDDEEDA